MIPMINQIFTQHIDIQIGTSGAVHFFFLVAHRLQQSTKYVG